MYWFDQDRSIYMYLWVTRYRQDNLENTQDDTLPAFCILDFPPHQNLTQVYWFDQDGSIYVYLWVTRYNLENTRDGTPCLLHFYFPSPLHKNLTQMYWFWIVITRPGHVFRSTLSDSLLLNCIGGVWNPQPQHCVSIGWENLFLIFQFHVSMFWRSDVR